MIYNKIIRQEHAKRAIEIALSGNHSIKFIGNDEAERLKQACDELGIEAITVKPCKCGNINDQEKDCLCRLFEIKNHQRSKKYRMPMDITIEAPRITPTAYLEYEKGKKQESIDEVKKRIEETKDIKVAEKITDKQTLELLESALKQLSLSLNQINSLKKVARTIAKLDNSSEIKACHLAEALQYRQRN
jgi:magnesium chelatase family protein